MIVVMELVTGFGEIYVVSGMQQGSKSEGGRRHLICQCLTPPSDMPEYISYKGQ